MNRIVTVKSNWLPFAGCAALLISTLATPAEICKANPGGERRKDSYFDETQAVTLFAFDDVSIPFSQNLKLELQSPRRHPANPVVRRGPAGSSDEWAVQFYGSVIRDGDKFRMWYVSVGNDRLKPDVPRSVPWRVAYAESDDGVNWIKPRLGLVKFNGNFDNNLVKLEPRLGVVNLKVLFEPDAEQADRRYKMGAHVWFPKNDVRLGTLAPYASQDGLTWKLLIPARPVEAELPLENLIIPPLHYEPVGGLYKWDGLYRTSGQNAIPSPRPLHGRRVRQIVSPDFVNWSASSAISFVRVAQHELLGPGRSREGEQTHEGISVWNRGNVLVGLSGMWHGAAEWSGVTVDLSLVISNDGILFREPAHEFVFLERGADGQWDQGGLLQGQGFENVGERTLIYYGAWDPRHWQNSPPRGGVGLAVLPRDRFAHLRVDPATKGPGNYQMRNPQCGFTTKSLPIESNHVPRLFVNAEGLSQSAQLKFELLDHQLRPLPGYSGQQAAIVTANGFQTPIKWNKPLALEALPDRIRIKATFQGAEKEDIRCSALYVRQDAR